MSTTTQLNNGAATPDASRRRFACTATHEPHEVRRWTLSCLLGRRGEPESDHFLKTWRHHREEQSGEP